MGGEDRGNRVSREGRIRGSGSAEEGDQGKRGSGVKDIM